MMFVPECTCPLFVLIPSSSWGESAGSTSVAHHMLANRGHTEGLFRAGFMESGSPLPTGFVDNAFLQRTYDGIVDDTGCSGRNDTLSCLRRVSAEDLKAAMDKTPNFLSFQVRMIRNEYLCHVIHCPIASNLPMVSPCG